MPKALQNVSGWMWRHRLKIIALVLVLSILAPKPAPAQIFTPVVAIIVSALTSINQALTSVIGGALDIMNQTLSVPSKASFRRYRISSRRWSIHKP